MQNWLRFSFFILFFVSICLIVSCLNNSSLVKNYSASLSFSPVIGTTYYLTSTQWTQTIQQVQGEDITNGNQISYSIAYSPSVDSMGGYLVNAVFTDFEMAM